MFESLQENISSAIKTLRGRGRLTEANMREGLHAGAAGPAGSRRQRRSCQGFCRQGRRPGGGRSGPEVVGPDAAACVHRASGVGRPDGPGGPFAAPQAGHDDPDALRPARLRQDDHLRQAGPHVAGARPQADARRRRLAASRGHPAVASARRAARHSRVRRSCREGSRGRLPNGGQARRSRRACKW